MTYVHTAAAEIIDIDAAKGEKKKAIGSKPQQNPSKKPDKGTNRGT